MRLVNKSSRPTAEVRRLVRIGMAGLDTKGSLVTVKDSRKWPRGEAWADQVEIRIPPNSRFPIQGSRRHRSSPINHDWQDWREALVALAAHEGKHMDLVRAACKEGVYPPTSQRVEMACEAWEHYVLRRYREG